MGGCENRPPPRTDAPSGRDRTRSAADEHGQRSSRTGQREEPQSTRAGDCDDRRAAQHSRYSRAWEDCTTRGYAHRRSYGRSDSPTITDRHYEPRRDSGSHYISSSRYNYERDRSRGYGEQRQSRSLERRQKTSSSSSIRRRSPSYSPSSYSSLEGSCTRSSSVSSKCSTCDRRRTRPGETEREGSSRRRRSCSTCSSSYTESDDYSRSESGSRSASPLPSSSSLFDTTARKGQPLLPQVRAVPLDMCNPGPVKLEFVRKCTEDAHLKDGADPKSACKVAPVYVKAAQVASKYEVLSDPRTKAEDGLAAKGMRPAFLEVDDAWILPEPLARLALDGIAKSIAGKAQLLGHLETLLPSDVSSAITDIILRRPIVPAMKEEGRALVTFRECRAAADAGRLLHGKSVAGLMITARTDKNMAWFERPFEEPVPLAPLPSVLPTAAAPTRQDSLSSYRVRKPGDGHRSHSFLSCMDGIPCVVIDFDYISTIGELREFLGDHAPLNIQPDRYSWHVHFGERKAATSCVDALDRARFGNCTIRVYMKRMWDRSSSTSMSTSTYPALSAMPSQGHSSSQIRPRQLAEMGRDLSSFYSSRKDSDKDGPAQERPLGSQSFSRQGSEIDGEIKSLPSFKRRRVEPEKLPPGLELGLDHMAKDATGASESPFESTESRTRKHHRRKKHHKSHDLSLALQDHRQPAKQLVEHASGSARTEGYYRQRQEDKSIFHDYSFIKDHIAEVAELNVAAANSAGRTNRAMNRRLASTIDAYLPSSDLFKPTAFHSRRKRLCFSRSSIHAYGLFTLEPIDGGDLVIEYLGELIRASVANIREARYERLGISSSYLFRLDDRMVVDATKRGNLARFINHSCMPTCTAKVITVDGRKRILIYAKRAIAAGEEITYDYKFPREDDPQKKVACYCATAGCRGFLN